MRALLAVYKREVSVYFRSFIAYAVGFAVIGFIGLLFMGNLNIAVQQQANVQQAGGIRPTDLVRFNLDVFVFLMFLIAPLLTMRLLSEESREGTLEVLMTLPMGEWVFVVAKFLAAWTYYTFLLLLTFLHVVLIWAIAPEMNWTFIGVMYLGAWLYGGAALAITLIWSAITEDQLVAAFLGSATILALFLSESLAVIVSEQALFQGAADFVREIGLSPHFQATMLSGILRAQDIAYFILMIILPLFITTLIVGTRRWRAS